MIKGFYFFVYSPFGLTPSQFATLVTRKYNALKVEKGLPVVAFSRGPQFGALPNRRCAVPCLTLRRSFHLNSHQRRGLLGFSFLRKVSQGKHSMSPILISSCPL